MTGPRKRPFLYVKSIPVAVPAKPCGHALRGLDGFGDMVGRVDCRE